MSLTPLHAIFALMSLFTVGGAVGVVLNRNLIYAAMYLVLSLFGIAGLFILLEAPFLAAVQILVYVGAISVLITITVMVTRCVFCKEPPPRQLTLVAVMAALVMVTLGFVIMTRFGGLTPAADVPADSIEQLGVAFVNPQAYLVPFEVASILLLGALIGAIFIARDDLPRDEEAVGGDDHA
ncbi:MAG: NADH-quinone oxidoreductase subunit J [Anaerolineae bacterium]|nr:NADH-quinone oxidoreductase subunit J [Anaerolineae bacterium]